MDAKRLLVRIHCQNCGERFTLRGKKDKNGRVETGFKRCLCDNENHFDISTQEEI